VEEGERDWRMILG